MNTDKFADDGSEEALATIRMCRDASERAWEDAEDDVEIERGFAVRRLCEDAEDACMAEYEHAISMLERQDSNDWLSVAKAALCCARSLEAEWGDASHAIEALEALATIEC